MFITAALFIKGPFVIFYLNLRVHRYLSVVSLSNNGVKQGSLDLIPGTTIRGYELE